MPDVTKGLEFHETSALLRSHMRGEHEAALARDKVYVQKLLKEDQISVISAPLTKTTDFLLIPCDIKTCAAKGREKNEDRLAREQALHGHWPGTETTLVKDATFVEPRHVISVA